MTDPVLELARQLIARPSVTPRDEGCQKLVADRLSEWGFKPEFMRFGDVDNLWLRRGSESPLLVFAGHTDVVPTGPRDQWSSDPFSPVLRNGKLYGRGAADMKSSIAAFTTAAARFVRDHPNHRGSIALLLTSDEEGPAVDGTVRVVKALQERQDHIDYCIVGEPTSEKRLGDTIKIGRRGSLSGRLVVGGVQGHVAYPHLATNPIHLCAPVLSILVGTGWDAGNEQFPPTTFQITHISTGDNADNVIPGEVSINFNFRHSTESTAEMLISRVEKVLNEHQLSYQLEWTISGSPFITTGGELIDRVRRAIGDELGVDTKLSTSGGTSDGRFIAPTGAQVVELGPINESIHKIDEHVALDAPRQLSNVYERILVSLLS